MQTRSARFDDAVRAPHTIQSTAVHQDLTDGSLTPLSIVDGSVTIDSTSKVRRTLNISVPNEQATWDALDTVGGEITVQQAIQYVDGKLEWIPLGVFVVDTDQIGYGPGGVIQMTCPDRWIKVQRNGLPSGSRTSVSSNLGWQEIRRLVEACWAGAYPFPTWELLDTTTATNKVGPILWDSGDREAAIQQIATAGGVEVFFAASGKAVLRPPPSFTNTSTPVWTVDAGPGGVLVAADRSRDRSRVANAIEVDSSASDVVFSTVIVKNTTAGDPLSVYGPLGYVPLQYSSPLIRNSGQALVAGQALLGKRLGVASQMTLEAGPNPALDALDIILCRLPQTDMNTARPTEIHLAETVTTPLMPSGTQQLATRSTRPSTDGT